MELLTASIVIPIWLEAVLTDQAFEVGEGNMLHVEGALQWHKVDIPKVETLPAH